MVDGDDLMIITKKGTTIRTPVDELRVMGRATQGVKLIRLDGEDEIASIAKVEEHLLKAFEEANRPDSAGMVDEDGNVIVNEISNTLPDANIVDESPSGVVDSDDITNPSEGNDESTEEGTSDENNENN